MTTTTKLVLVAGTLLGAGLAARLVRRRQRNPRTAADHAVTVGAGSGTRDWWLARNEKRRQKHLRMMTAKG